MVQLQIVRIKTAKQDSVGVLTLTGAEAGILYHALTELEREAGYDKHAMEVIAHLRVVLELGFEL